MNWIFHPIASAIDWFTSLPLEWLMGGSLVAGLLVGAWLGRVGVAVVLAAGGVLLFMRSRPAAESAAPTHRTKRRAPPKQQAPVESWFDRAKRGEKT